MGNRKFVDSGPVSKIEVIMEGWLQKTLLDGKVWKTEDLSMTAGFIKSHKTWSDGFSRDKVEVKDSDEPKLATHADVENFVQTYSTLRYKYTHKHTKYKKDGKYWQSFVEATNLALEHNMDFYQYIITIRNFYTKVGATDVVFPWPSQMAGEVAEEIIQQAGVSKSGKIPDEVKAARKANAKRRVPLEQDEEFLKLKRKFKTGQFTRYDYEYVRLRYLQVGETPDWLDKYGKQLEDKERGEEKTV